MSTSDSRRPEEAEARRRAWEVEAEELENSSPGSFTAAREAMIAKFGGVINPTVEDVLKFIQTRA